MVERIAMPHPKSVEAARTPASSGPPVLEFENVTVVEAGKTILRDVSFAMRERDKVVLWGESGAGKSTVLRAAVGAHIPSAGLIRFRGVPLDRITLAALRRSVACIFQEPVLGQGTALQILQLPFTFKANSARKPGPDRIGAALERVRLDPAVLKSDAAVLSGGEKQRLAIARALLLDKNIFFVDEVTAGLDERSVEAIHSLFSEPSLTLLSVSHDRRWLDICTRFALVAGGTLGPMSDRAEVVAGED